jgi:hypothetical protein
MMYVIRCQSLCKCHNVPPPSTIVKEKRKRSEHYLPEGSNGVIFSSEVTQAGQGEGN